MELILILTAALIVFILLLELEHIIKWKKRKKLEAVELEIHLENTCKNSCSVDDYKLPEPSNECSNVNPVHTNDCVFINADTKEVFDGIGNSIGFAEGDIFSGEFKVVRHENN